MNTNKSDITWAAIIPLIGGVPLAMEQVFKSKPKYVLSWSPFQYNDSHYINYIRKQGWTGNYYVLDHNETSIIPNVTSEFNDADIPYVDVIGGTPPCAGLSSFSTTSSADSKVNDWMINATKFVLETCKPKIYWFENAPRLGTEKGKPVADKLFNIAKDNGYSFLIYTTESRLHENCQIRPRTFGFFFKNDYFNGTVNILSDIPHKSRTFEDFMTNIAKKIKNKEKTLMDEPINKSNLQDDPYYSYCYNHVNAKSHRDFVEKICTYEKSVNLLEQTLKYGEYKYEEIANWFDSHNFEKAAKRIRYIKSKVDDNKGYWTHGITIARGQTPAFIGVMPHSLVHPYQERFITYREGLNLMGFPEDFELNTDKPWTCSNHICQNVPVRTAVDMVKEIVKWINDPNTNSLNATYAIQRNKQRDVQIKELCTESIDNLFA